MEVNNLSTNSAFVLTLIALLLIIPFVSLHSVDEESKVPYFKIEGKVYAPEQRSEDWLTSTEVRVNGGEYLGFLRSDGSFVVNNVPSGSYVVEISNPNFVYEPARIDITSRGKMRARKVNYLQSSQVLQISYPLKFRTKGQLKYFQVRETMKITDFLFNPMVIMMVMPLLLIMVLPKVMNTEDAEAQREMQQSMQLPKFDMPDLSEMMTSLFTGGSANTRRGKDKNQEQARSLKSSKKRS